MSKELTSEEKLQAALVRVRYLEQRLTRMSAITAFIVQYDQQPPAESNVNKSPSDLAQWAADNLKTNVQNDLLTS